MPFASEVGRWDTRFDAQVSPMRMHLLRNGKVLYHDFYDVANIRLWDPDTGTITTPPAPPRNIFCSGHAFRGDGTLLVAGGTEEEWVGLPYAHIYDPIANSWAQITPDMNDRRWYPTCTTLDNDEVLVTSGTTGFNVVPIYNTLLQARLQPTGPWRDLTTATMPFQDYYPWMYVIPNGDVFTHIANNPLSRYLRTPTGATPSWQDGPARSEFDRSSGTAAMYLPGKVIVIGGRFGGGNPPLATAELIDLMRVTPPPLDWESAGEMANERKHHNATLLVPGDVLVTGGTYAMTEDEEEGELKAVRVAERWIPPGPGSGWAAMAAFNDPLEPQTYRGYHSTALLLTDGRVLSGGGNQSKITPTYYRRDMEIFWPPYLFQPNSDVLAPRPTISVWPAAVNYGATFTVKIEVATPPHNIIRATLLRPGSVTHSVNFEQRFLELGVPVDVGGGYLQLTAPANSRLAPPGYYLLFLINHLGVPSVAKFIKVPS